MEYKSLLRHHLATLGMRFGHALFRADDSFADFEAGEEVQTPYDLVYHLSSMLQWSNDKLLDIKFQPPERKEWRIMIDSFFQSLKQLDQTIQSDTELDEKLILMLYQGPLNDAMTHIGQLFTLRRLSGDPLHYVNYLKAEVTPGKFDYKELYI